jgi:hypothetical protein
MSGDTIIAMTGLMGLAAAGLAGALWDGPLVTALFRGERVLPVECRHAMRVESGHFGHCGPYESVCSIAAAGQGRW